MFSNVSRSENSLNFSAVNNNLNNSPVNKIPLVNKGEAGYIARMDLDDDGIVTMSEFNEYCSTNGISEEDKIKLLMTIQTSKMNEQIIKEQKEKRENEKEEDEAENESIYARRGESKYDECMDTDKNSVVTNEEYLKYCEKNANDNKDEKEEKVISKEVSNYKKIDELKNEEANEPEIKIEIDA